MTHFNLLAHTDINIYTWISTGWAFFFIKIWTKE